MTLKWSNVDRFSKFLILAASKWPTFFWDPFQVCTINSLSSIFIWTKSAQKKRFFFSVNYNWLQIKNFFYIATDMQNFQGFLGVKFMCYNWLCTYAVRKGKSYLNFYQNKSRNPFFGELAFHKTWFDSMILRHEMDPVYKKKFFSLHSL